MLPKGLRRQSLRRRDSDKYPLGIKLIVNMISMLSFKIMDVCPTLIDEEIKPTMSSL